MDYCFHAVGVTEQSGTLCNLTCTANRIDIYVIGCGLFNVRCVNLWDIRFNVIYAMFVRSHRT